MHIPTVIIFYLTKKYNLANKSDFFDENSTFLV